MRIGVAATPDVAIPTLDWLITSEHDLVLVITQPDKPAGRGRAIKQSVVGDWAASRGIPIIKPESSDDLIGVINDLDCVVTIGYGVLLPENILEHPKWRSFELLQRLAQEGPSAVDEALNMIARGELPRVQVGQSSVAPKISKQEALLNFSDDAKTLVNAIRAFTYEPGAWCTWNNESFKITSATIVQDYPLKKGEIFLDGQRVFVGCADNSSVELLTVVPAGKKEMSAADWARGARLKGGESFG